MLTEEFVNLISTICAQYSYVSRSKQYIDTDKNHFTLETATSDIITKPTNTRLSPGKASLSRKRL